jgi:hypothetical protein
MTADELIEADVVALSAPTNVPPETSVDETKITDGTHTGLAEAPILATQHDPAPALGTRMPNSEGRVGRQKNRKKTTRFTVGESAFSLRASTSLFANEMGDIMRKWRLSMILAMTAALGACATVGSQKSDSPRHERESVGAYALPMALVPIELWIGRSGVHVVARQPVLKPDPSHAYRLEYSPSVTSSDSFKVEVEPATGFLKSSTAVIEDRTVNAVEALTPRAPKPESSAAAPKGRVLDDGAIRVVRILVDPSHPADVNGSLEHALTAFAGSPAYQALCPVATPPARNAVRSSLPPVCEQLVSRVDHPNDNPASRTDQSPQVFVQFSNPPPNSTSSSNESCNRGLCYRLNRTWTIRLTTPNGEMVEEAFLAPNGAPLESIDIRGAAFVRRETKPVFASGMLVSNEITKPSSVERAAALPFQAARAAFAAPAEVLQLRVNYQNKQKELIEAEAKRLKAEQDRLAAERALIQARNNPTSPTSQPPPNAGTPESGPEEAARLDVDILAVASPFESVKPEDIRRGNPGAPPSGAGPRTGAPATPSASDGEAEEPN